MMDSCKISYIRSHARKGAGKGANLLRRHVRDPGEDDNMRNQTNPTRG